MAPRTSPTTHYGLCLPGVVRKEGETFDAMCNDARAVLVAPSGPIWTLDVDYPDTVRQRVPVWGTDYSVLPGSIDLLLHDAEEEQLYLVTLASLRLALGSVKVAFKAECSSEDWVKEFGPGVWASWDDVPGTFDNTEDHRDDFKRLKCVDMEELREHDGPFIKWLQDQGTTLRVVDPPEDGVPKFFLSHYNFSAALFESDADTIKALDAGAKAAGFKGGKVSKWMDDRNIEFGANTRVWGRQQQASKQQGSKRARRGEEEEEEEEQEHQDEEEEEEEEEQVQARPPVQPRSGRGGTGKGTRGGSKRRAPASSPASPAAPAAPAAAVQTTSSPVVDAAAFTPPPAPAAALPTAPPTAQAVAAMVLQAVNVHEEKEERLRIRVEALERSLKDADDLNEKLYTRLVTTQKELSTTKEELGATKEELSTTKEELSTTKEELSTTKEELDAMKELEAAEEKSDPNLYRDMARAIVGTQLGSDEYMSAVDQDLSLLEILMQCDDGMLRHTILHAIALVCTQSDLLHEFEELVEDHLENQDATPQQLQNVLQMFNLFEVEKAPLQQKKALSAGWEPGEFAEFFARAVPEVVDEDATYRVYSIAREAVLNVFQGKP